MGLEWNPTQTAIKESLQQGKGAEETAKALGVSRTLVIKVEQAIAKEKAHAEAAAKQKADEEARIKAEAEKNKGKGKGGERGKTTDNPLEASAIQMDTKDLHFPLNGQILMSWQMAQKWGFTGSMGDWVSLVSEDYWLGRGISPYKTDADKQIGGNGHGRETVAVGGGIAAAEDEYGQPEP